MRQHSGTEGNDRDHIYCNLDCLYVFIASADHDLVRSDIDNLRFAYKLHPSRLAVEPECTEDMVALAKKYNFQPPVCLSASHVDQDAYRALVIPNDMEDAEELAFGQENFTPSWTLLTQMLSEANSTF